MSRIFSIFFRTVYRSFLHKRFFRVSLLLSVVAERYLDFFTPVTVAVLVGLSGCRRNSCPVVLLADTADCCRYPHLCSTTLMRDSEREKQDTAECSIDPWCCSDRVRRKLPEKNCRLSPQDYDDHLYDLHDPKLICIRMTRFICTRFPFVTLSDPVDLHTFSER